MANIEDVSHSSIPVKVQGGIPQNEQSVPEAKNETGEKGEGLPVVPVEVPVVVTEDERQGKIEALAKTIKETNEGLAKVRESLGLPSTQEDVPSVVTAKENLARLDNESAPTPEMKESTSPSESSTENVSEKSAEQSEIVEPSTVVSQEAIKKCESDGYKVETYGRDISVVVLGENHYDKDMKAKEVELIKAIKPEFVLYESFYGHVYDPAKKSLERQEGRLFMDFYDDETHKDPKVAEYTSIITSAADEVGCKVVGCDLTLAERGQVGKELAKSSPDKYIFDEEFNVLQRKDDPNYTILGTDVEYMQARDNKMAEMVLEYRKKSQKPIIVIMGNHHAGNIHEQKKLQEQGFGYVYVASGKPTTKTDMYSRILKDPAV